MMSKVLSLLRKLNPKNVAMKRLSITIIVALLTLGILLQITVFITDGNNSVVSLLPEQLTSSFNSLTKGKGESTSADQSSHSSNIVQDIHVVHNPSDDTVEEEEYQQTTEPEEEDSNPLVDSEQEEYNSVSELQSEVEYLMKLPVYERLGKIFPYKQSEELIEKNVIQSWKNTNVEELGLDGASWRVDDDFNYTLYDDNMIKEFLNFHFGKTVPELINTFDHLPRNILRYDFFRYIAIFIHGGTYTDSDTFQVKRFNEWPAYNKATEPHRISAVVGLEGECDCIRWQGIFPRRVQFCQWTFQAKKHHPLLKWLISSIIETFEINYNQTTMILNKSDQEFNFSDGSESYYDGILEWTGPAAFTDAIFTYANSLNEPEIINPNDQETIFRTLRNPNPEDKKWSTKSSEVINFGWENVTRIDSPILIDDLLILPQVYFNGKAGRNEATLVEHKYHGSWKSSKASK